MAYAHMAMHKPVSPAIGQIYRYSQLNWFHVFCQILNCVLAFLSNRENQEQEHAKYWIVQDDASALLI